MTDPITDNKTTKVCSVCHKSLVGDHKDCPGEPGNSSNNAESPMVPDPLIGTIFAEKYEVLSVLGRGGMSLVYKARHKFMDRIVAVKVLLEHLVTDVGAVQRFQQESKAASTLNHQNIVTVYDFGQTPNGQAYFVMDCLEGQSLAECIENQGRLDVARALRIFEQICDGLEHAHQKGIIHRDLKPNNIILMKDDNGLETIKIVDFGIAKILGTDGTPQQRLTQTGEIFGSPFYMSPEQCQGFPLDARSDLYSLGCLMYETLSGYPPQMGETFVATALKHINDQPPAFSEIAPSANIPRQVEYVIQRCLEKSPKDRFATADQIKQALLDAALAAGVPGLRAGAVKVTSPQSPMRQTWEKLSQVFDTGSYAVSKQKKRALTVANVVLILVPIVLLAGTVGVAVLYPGPDEDRGTPWNKLRWQFAMSNAKSAGDRGDLKEVQKQFKAAEDLTKTFQDHFARLTATVQLEAEVYRTLARYDAVDAANQRIVEIGYRQVDAELKSVEKWLAEFHAQEAQDPISSQASMQAGSTRIMLLSAKLHARRLYAREESLLHMAIKEFSDSGLSDMPQMADFKMALADCLQAQQNLVAVRPLLLGSLRIRESKAGLNNGALPPTPINSPATQKLVRSLLKIGQFDRDQSNFGPSELELNRAKKIIDAYYSHDQELVTECANSIVDLKRQMLKDNNGEGSAISRPGK